MNDDELTTTLREQRGKIPMTTPVEQIISRGRKVRARRRIPGVAASVGAVAAVAVAATVALPARHPATSRPASRPAPLLAAWTVTRQADGSIQVTFRDLRDAAGLQRVLRADGVPASVTFPGPQNPACQNFVSPHPAFSSPGQRLPWGLRVLGFPHPNLPQDALVIDPAALPSGVGLALYGQGTEIGEPYDQNVGVPVGLSVGFVHTSRQCTGS